MIAGFRHGCRSSALRLRPGTRRSTWCRRAPGGRFASPWAHRRHLLQGLVLLSVGPTEFFDGHHDRRDGRRRTCENPTLSRTIGSSGG
jgi:hypothetical protein